MEICPTCGSMQPHDGACPAVAAGGVAQKYAPTPLSGGQVLQGRYEILHMLGQGGMGTVFMARDLRLKGRSCVVKKLRDDFYRDEDRQKAQAFFKREMDVLAELEHRHIVQILDFFAEDSDFYLVMEYVQGNNLHYMLHEERGGEPFLENTVVDWALQICDVLSYLHSRTPPIIYRDLKPSNVMIDLKGEVKLVDFGIARREEGGEHTHVVSAGYSPPEQYWGSADIRSDIYSLGATMHFLLTGQDPQALHQSSPAQLNPQVSDYVDQLVQRATAQEVNDRFQTVEEFMEALLHKDYLPAPESARSRLGEIVTGVALLIVAVFIFVVQSLPTIDPKQGAAQHMVSGERDDTEIHEAPVDQSQSPIKPTADTPSHASVNNKNDLAVQLMDERDLTDPAGLNGEQADAQPKAKRPFFLQWLNHQHK